MTKLLTQEEIFKELVYSNKADIDLNNSKDTIILNSLLGQIKEDIKMEKFGTYLNMNHNASIKKIKNLEDKLIDTFNNSELNEKDKDLIKSLLVTQKEILKEIDEYDMDSIFMLNSSLDQIIVNINNDEFDNDNIKNLFIEMYNDLSITIISKQLLFFIDYYSKLKNLSREED